MFVDDGFHTVLHSWVRSQNFSFNLLDLYDYNLINISKISGIRKLLDWLKDWQLGD